MNRIFSDCLHLDPERFPMEELHALDDGQWDRLIDMVAGHRVTVVFHDRLVKALAREEKALAAGADTVEGKDRIHPNLNQPEPDQSQPGRSEPNQTNSTHPEPFTRAIEKLHTFSRHLTKVNLQKQHDLLTVLRRLDAAGIPVILLKGAWLAHAVYEAPGMREMADLDLMVRVRDLDQTVAILREIGYKTGRDLKDLDIEIQRKHHLPSFRREGAIMIELHWNITHEGHDDFVPPDGFWERSREVRVSGVPARTLSPEDMLLHLSRHITYQHMFLPGIRPVLDVALFLKKLRVDGAGSAEADGVGALDWDVLTREATARGWNRGVWLTLRMAQYLFGAPVPDDALRRLEDGGGMRQSDSSSGSAKLTPDDPDAIVRTASEQMLTLYFRRNLTKHQVTNLMNKKGISGKLKHILGRLFPPRKRIAQIYILPHDSAKVWLLYPAYIAKLLWRSVLYSRNAMQKEEGVAGQVARREQLRVFLDGG